MSHCSTTCCPCVQGWEWEGPWEVESSGNVDPEGWAYAFDVTQLRYPPPPNSGSMKAHDFVRRRRLVRKRRRVELPSSVLDMAQAHAAPGEANVRRVSDLFVRLAGSCDVWQWTVYPLLICCQLCMQALHTVRTEWQQHKSDQYSALDLQAAVHGFDYSSAHHIRDSVNLPPP